jgi:hypothetical protein
LFTSIIDWDFTFVRPLQKHAVFPKLLENVPGAAPFDVPPSLAYLDFKSDKEYFVSIVADKEAQLGKSIGQKPSVAMLLKSSSERNSFEMSHHIAAVHDEFVRRFCERTRKNIQAAREQIGCFITQNPEFSDDDEAIRDVTKYLDEQLAKLESGN